MESLPISKDALRSAREALGLSQARLASEAGINRTYLSQFENGLRILRESEAAQLVDYFAAQGVDLTGDSERVADDLACQDLPAKVCAERGYELRDGFLIPEALELGPDRIAMILEEIHSLRERAHELWREEIKSSWLGFDGDELEAVEELHQLALRFFVLVEELQGSETFALYVTSAPNTIAARLAEEARA